MCGLQARNDFSRNGLTCKCFDVVNFAFVAKLGQCHGQAITPCTASAANAVGVVFRFHRQTEVEYVGDGGHIDTTRSNVCRYQELHLALAQSHQTAVAQALAQSTMQSNGRETVLLQVVGQSITFNLGAGKHNRLVDRGVTQKMVEQFALVVRVICPMQHLANVVVFFLWRIDLDALGLAHDSRCQLLDTWRKRSAKHHGLFTFDRELVDLSQVIGKTEIQHAVSFVDH